MIEIDNRHTPYEVSDLDAGCLLSMVADDRDLALVSARRQLRLAHQWCVLNPVVDDGPGASWSDDPALASLDLDDHLGGDGTPSVAAFAAEEYAAVAGLTRYAALAVLADTLDLHHRLPNLWKKVENLEVPGWKARRVAELSRKLSATAASWFDTHLATTGRYGWRSIEQTLAMAVAKFHPELIKNKTGPLSKDDWDVTLTHKHGPSGTAPGTSTLDVIGDSLDLSRFYDLICAEAERLKNTGDTDTLAQRKSKALGSLAETQGTLNFDSADTDCGIAGNDASTTGATGATGARTTSGAGTTGQPTRPRPGRGLRVIVHTTLADLLGLNDTLACDGGADGVLLAETDRLGPVLVAQLRDWLHRHGSIASITPVIDMNRTGTVDRHDPPEWMANQVRARDPHCVFPHCTRPSIDCDLDHVVPYDTGPPDLRGPPGQTNPGNLAPLCRRHHLTKTHGSWRYRRNDDGTYTWTNRHNQTWLVTPLGTIRLPDLPS